jgi:endonuclease
MHPDFPEWLSDAYTEKTKSSRISNVKKIEECYGSLDEHFAKGTYKREVINTLEYSTKDEQANKPNPSKIPFKGNIRNNLNMYKNAAKLYESFLNQGLPIVPPGNSDPISPTEETIKQKLSLERDMEEALRRNIANLDTALKIIDEGTQWAVDSGFIDITCEDNDGLVVVELKAGKADSRAIGQILGYMGDLQEEESGKKVRGILVAHDFDKRAKAAARVVPTLTLKKYSIEFKFMAED